jgi:outer membrane protease
MNAVIWDVNLRYDFLKYAFGRKKNVQQDKKVNMKLGALIGYRYERFGYKNFGLYQTCKVEEGYGDGQIVSEYKVKYRLPYYGLAAEFNTDKFGILLIGKYAFKATAQDLDNHVLHERTNYGDYRKNPNVFMANAVMFWNFHKGWQASVGADIALIRINGTSWDENHNPSWDKDQNIDTKQFIYWVGLGYKF